MKQKKALQCFCRAGANLLQAGNPGRFSGPLLTLEFEIRQRQRRDGFTLSSDSLSFPLWYLSVSDALGYARFRAATQPARISVYGNAGEMIEAIEHEPERLGSTLGRL